MDNFFRHFRSRRFLVVLVMVLVLAGVISAWFYATQETPERKKRITEQAIREQNVEVCKKIKAYIDRESCFALVANAKGDPDTCSIVSEFSLRDGCLSIIAFGKRDPGICERVGERARKDSCFYDLAVFKEDPTLCKNITNEAWRDQCDSKFEKEE